MKLHKIALSRGITIPLHSGSTIHVRPTASIEVSIEDGEDSSEALQNIRKVLDVMLHEELATAVQVALKAVESDDVINYLTGYFTAHNTSSAELIKALEAKNSD